VKIPFGWAIATRGLYWPVYGFRNVSYVDISCLRAGTEVFMVGFLSNGS